MVVFSGVGNPQSISNANGGKTYAFNNIGTSSNVPVAPANPSRRSITFINPSANTIYVSMTSQMSQAGVATPLNPTTSLLGGTIPIVAGNIVTLADGEIQLPWQALAIAGAANPFTVIDSNA